MTLAVAEAFFPNLFFNKGGGGGKKNTYRFGGRCLMNLWEKDRIEKRNVTGFTFLCSRV